MEKEVVIKKKYSKVFLTEKGTTTALKYYPSYLTLKNFFEKSLGLTYDEAVKSALALVSELSDETIRQMCEGLTSQSIINDTAAG